MTDRPVRAGDLSRRELLASALVLPLAGALAQRGSATPVPLPDLSKSRYRVVGATGAERLVVTREWTESNHICASRVTNPTGEPVTVNEVVLFEVRPGP